MLRLIRVLARDTSLRTGDGRVTDSVPVQRGRPKDTARRSGLAG